MRRPWSAALITAALLGCSQAWTTVETLERDGVVFTRRPWGIVRTPPALTEEEARLGWVAYVPGSADGIGPEAFPARSEIGAPMLMFACPGEREAATFAVYAQRAVTVSAAQPGPLVGARRATIPPTAVDVRAVRIWPQRTDWNSREYYVIPELLEKRYGVHIPAGRLQQWWVTVNVPGEARPGLYEGYIRLNAAGKHQHVPLVLRVLPFQLETPPDHIWGLWPDTRRWRSLTDEQILEEVRDWRAHGINTSLMYPLTHGRFALRNGDLEADLSEFERMMDLQQRGGMTGPVVMSLQGVSDLIHRLLGQSDDDYGPEFEAMLVQIARTIEKLWAANNWPPCVYHTVDEPAGNAALETEAKETLRILHQAGLRTFTTADVDFAGSVLDPFLDVRCYHVGYCATSAQEATARARECRQAGDVYWWYGMGCYSGQEGSVAVNRHLGGFLFAKSLAQGAWAWTFQRPNGDPYDDFDGEGEPPTKDACITYPARDGKGPNVPTLQWEGIREGVDDARYVHVLQSLIAELRAASKPEGAATASRLERELATLLDRVPWLGGHLSNRQAQAIRWRLAALILDCMKALGRAAAPEPPPRAKQRPEVRLDYCLQAGDSDSDDTGLPIPVANVPLLSKAPSVDGMLDQCWANAARIGPLSAPDGSPTPHLTEAWVARDAHNVYFAFRCHEDRTEAIRAEVKEHDGEVWRDDSVEVLLQPDPARNEYLHFILNTLGTGRESRWRQGREQLDWAMPWLGAAAPCPEGWCAEMAIPRAQLPGGGSECWSANLHRNRRIPGGVEYGCWSPTLGGYHVPERFGKLVLQKSPVRVKSVWLAPPVWGDNVLTLHVEGTEGLSAVEVRAWTSRTPDRTHRPAAQPLPPDGAEIRVSYELAGPGLQPLTVEITGLGTSRRGAQVYAGPPLVLSFARQVPPAVEISQGVGQLLRGWHAADFEARLHLGRRLGRQTKLQLAVKQGGATLASVSVPVAEATNLLANIGTAGLLPGFYTMVVAVEGPRGLRAQVKAPFEVIEGPW